MSKERGEFGMADVMRYVAIAFFGMMARYAPENTSYGRWAVRQKKKLQSK